MRKDKGVYHCTRSFYRNGSEKELLTIVSHLTGITILPRCRQILSLILLFTYDLGNRMVKRWIPGRRAYFHLHAKLF